MTDYISREAVITAVKAHCPAKYETAVLVRIVCVPAADVAEVRHGCWEIKFKWEPLAWDTDPLDWDRYDEKTHSEEVDYYACSECGYDGGSWKPSWKYCPNCGAKMEDEK